MNHEAVYRAQRRIGTTKVGQEDTIRGVKIAFSTAVALSILLGTACGRPDLPVVEEMPVEVAAAALLPEEMAGLDPASWIKIYDPARAFNGFTLALYERRLPMLLDMNGNVVHSWPGARVKSRLRLLENGSLLAIGTGRQVVEYDWDGNLTWEYQVPKGLPHHDVIRLSNGHTLLVVRSHGSRYDDLLAVDRNSRVVWEWRSEDHLKIVPESVSDPEDVTHINSVQELPPNRWFDGGDSRFRPGNLLISARNLNRVFVIDRQNGMVVWTFEKKLDMQHEALMIEPGYQRHGNILIFSNGTRGIYGYRQSAVLEVRPTDGEILWEYRADGFYLRSGGLEQPLPNGNAMVVSDDRTFEIDRSGEIVWQWVPPFRPTRSQRYAVDRCPQLAALARGRQLLAVWPPAGYRHVDPQAYWLAYREERRVLRLESGELEGEDLEVLRFNNFCRRLFLPAEPVLELSFGLNPSTGGGTEGHGAAVRFAAFLESSSERPAVRLFEDTVAPPDFGRRKRSFNVAEHAYKWVRLCIETEASSEPEAATESMAYWMNQAISPGHGGEGYDPAVPISQRLTLEEREVRLEHLEALGYVD